MSVEGIGYRIRRARRRLRWTLKDLAARCGFSVSLLSKIETGHTRPPVATLVKIANGLGVSTSALLGECSSSGTVLSTATEAAAAMQETDKGYQFVFLAVDRGEKLMQPMLFEAQKGQVIAQSLTHSGEEFIYVLAGRMQYSVGPTEYTLGPGDSLYFDAEQPHDLTPLSREVRYLAVFSESPIPAEAPIRRTRRIDPGRSKPKG